MAAESTTNPTHSVVVLMLDPSTMPGGYSFEALRNRLGAAIAAWPHLQERLAETPFHLTRPRWVHAGAPDLGVRGYGSGDYVQN